MATRLRERKSNRLKGWNYSNQGYYFVTLCANHHGNIFGEVANGKIILNEAGRIVAHYWFDIPNHCEYCGILDFVIMPDHMHAIVLIKNVGNRHACSVQENRNLQMLPIVMGSFKAASSRLIHKSGHPDFKWHKSYYDRIIRDKDEYERIRKYIIDNPKNWHK